MLNEIVNFVHGLCVGLESHFWGQIARWDRMVWIHSAEKVVTLRIANFICEGAEEALMSRLVDCVDFILRQKEKHDFRLLSLTKKCNDLLRELMKVPAVFVTLVDKGCVWSAK